MIRLACILVLAAAACGPSGDPLIIKYSFTQGSEQACLDDDGDPIVDCNAIPMTCDSVALLRILDPEPNQGEAMKRVYVDQCVDIPNGGAMGTQNLCKLNGTPFEIENKFPTELVEIQLAIYPRDLISDDFGNVTCPSDIDFTNTGFIAPTNPKQPALAGVAYADGYDREVTIELGCNDTMLIDSAACRNENAIDLSASVLDFDTSLSVSLNTAGDLSVRIGEPTQSGLDWIFDLGSSVELPLIPGGPEPIWEAPNAIVSLIDYACVQVLEVEPRATPSLTCRARTGMLPPALDLVGSRVARLTLNEVLEAFPGPNADFPEDGLVVGKVIDQSGAPVSGAMVSDLAGATVQYLSADRLSYGGVTTTSSGIFVSTNASFDMGGGPNHWTASRPPLVQRNDPVGGLVKDRLTVIIIQLGNPL